MLATTLWTIAGIVMGLWAWRALASVLQARKFARLFQREVKAKYREHRPRVALIVPFRGAEPGLAANVRGVLSQDYPDYRVLLVVDDAADPAHAVLQQVLAEHPAADAEILIAGPAHEHESQKIHNQLAAMERLREDARGEQVWAFADSDAIPGPQWLGHLVGPLQKETVGVTTGYRWLIPDPDDPHPNLLTTYASIMNSSVMSFAGSGFFRYAWGGSMAVRVETAERGALIRRFTNAVCDDYQVSRMVHDLGMEVYFVPSCVVPSPARWTWASLLDFVQRQYVLTRLHEPLLYAAGLWVLLSYPVSLVVTVAALVAGLVSAPAGIGWKAAVGVLLFVHAMNHVRAMYRRQAAKRALDARAFASLRRTFVHEHVATAGWMTLHAVLALTGLSRSFHWRGLVYDCRTPNDVTRHPAR